MYAHEPEVPLENSEFCPNHHLYAGRLSYTDFEQILLSVGVSEADVEELFPKRQWEETHVTKEEAALVRRVLAMSGYTAPMHDRLEARRIVDRFLPPMSDRSGPRGFVASVREGGDNC